MEKEMKNVVRDGLAEYLRQEEERGRQEGHAKVSIDSILSYSCKDRQEVQGRPEDQSIKLRYEGLKKLVAKKPGAKKAQQEESELHRPLFSS